MVAQRGRHEGRSCAAGEENNDTNMFVEDGCVCGRALCLCLSSAGDMRCFLLLSCMHWSLKVLVHHGPHHRCFLGTKTMSSPARSYKRISRASRNGHVLVDHFRLMNHGLCISSPHEIGSPPLPLLSNINSVVNPLVS